MTIDSLVSSVENLANTTIDLSDAVLASGAYAWGDYGGLRLALLGTAQDLDDLDADLLQQRREARNQSTRAQALLGSHRRAYRDLRALLVGLDAETLQRAPAEGEWSVLQTLMHIYRAERAFLISILAGLGAQEREEAATFPSDEMADALVAAAGEQPSGDDAHALIAAYDRLHKLVASELSGLTDHQLNARSPFWEGDQPSVRFRIGRFTAHLQEHTNQVEKTLRMLDLLGGEAKMLVRQMVGRLASVEAALLGAPELEAACADLADVIEARVEEVMQAIAGNGQMMDAINSGDLAAVQALLEQNRGLANAFGEDQHSAALTAAYRHQPEIVQVLHDAGAELDLFDAAATGDLETVRQYVEWNGESANWVAKDGFTPLQLACYFGHAEVARYLVEQGADVRAVSRNAQGLQPIHAAVAGRTIEIVRLLIEAGADVDVEQASGHTPLQAAQQNGDPEMITLLQNALN